MAARVPSIISCPISAAPASLTIQARNPFPVRRSIRTALAQARGRRASRWAAFFDGPFMVEFDGTRDTEGRRDRRRRRSRAAAGRSSAHYSHGEVDFRQRAEQHARRFARFNNAINAVQSGQPDRCAINADASTTNDDAHAVRSTCSGAMRLRQRRSAILRGTQSNDTGEQAGCCSGRRSQGDLFSLWAGPVDDRGRRRGALGGAKRE